VQVTFLGTGAGIPTRARNVSAVALRLPQQSHYWLFDCGEGTQHQILRSSLSISQIRRIFITHLHGDHLFGLPGLLASGKLGGASGVIDIYGPAGLKRFLHACRETTHDGGAGEADGIRIHEVEPGTIYKDNEFTVECRPLRHRIPTFGYRVREHDRRGRFLVELAREIGIPEGPLFGRLKRGESVTLDGGRKIESAELCEPDEQGRIFAYCTDTAFCDNAIELARDADVLIHEATFAEQGPRTRAPQCTLDRAHRGNRRPRRSSPQIIPHTHQPALRTNPRDARPPVDRRRFT
jgi:ribonuclease Z